MPYVIFLALAPTATAHLARPGVMDAVMEALQALTALGLPEDFARLFVQRLSHLLTLREAGILRAAHGPPRGLALRRVNRHLHNGARIDDRHPLYPKIPPLREEEVENYGRLDSANALRDVHVRGGAAIHVGTVWPICHKTASVHEFP